MLSKEFIFANLKELKALRDENESPVFVDFALLLLAQKPDYPLSKFRAALKKTNDQEGLLQSFFNDFFPKQTRSKSSRCSINPDCPYINNKCNALCCCQQGFVSSENVTPLGIDAMENTLSVLSSRDKSKLTKYVQRYKNVTPFTNFIKEAIESKRIEYEKKKWTFKVKDFYRESGGVTYARVQQWIAPDKARRTRPDLKSVIGFMIITKSLLKDDARNVLKSIGFTLSRQFDFDLTVLFFMSIKDNIDLDIATFNEALISIGIPPDSGNLLTTRKSV